MIELLLRSRADPNATSYPDPDASTECGKTVMHTARCWSPVRLSLSKIAMLRRMLVAHGYEEELNEDKMWRDAQSRVTEGERLWREGLNAELMPHVGHTWHALDEGPRGTKRKEFEEI